MQLPSRSVYWNIHLLRVIFIIIEVTSIMNNSCKNFNTDLLVSVHNMHVGLTYNLNLQLKFFNKSAKGDKVQN